VHDLRLAFRQLAKAPGFAAVAILTLALCIGANSAIFSVLHAIVLQPYPWPASENLVYVHNTYPKIGLDRAGCSIPDYLDRRAGVASFEETALYTGLSANLSAAGNPERVAAVSVTPSLFPLLKTSPTLGRAFTAADAQVGAAKTVVLSDALWQNRFGRDPQILGQSISLNGEPVTVIGVMPAGFYFPTPRAQLWLPFVFTDRQKSDAGRHNEFSNMIARLKPGATREQAQREVDAVSQSVRDRLPDEATGWKVSGFGGRVFGFLDDNIRDVRAMLWLVQAGVVAALLIGCANVASLLLARASARGRELAIRAALGASRGRLMRQLLTESLVLFLAGGALGLVVASWSLSALGSLGISTLPRAFAISLDGSVFGFTLLCALLTGLGFGVLPAWSATRGNTASALKDAGTRATAGRRHLWLRSSLVVTEIALALLLLTTATLLLRSFARLHDVSPGFSADHVLTASLSLPNGKYATPEKQIALQEQLLARLSALPGVTAAGVTTNLPFSGNNNQSSYNIVGYTPPAGQPEPHGMIRQVSPGFFSALNVPLLRGRLFTPADTRGGAKVVVIDRVLADRYWPGGDPLGHQIEWRNGPATPGGDQWTIVGVVATIHESNLEVPVSKETLYFPFAQTPNNLFTLVLKTAASPAALTAAVRAAVLATDPEQPIFDIKTMDDRLGESLAVRRSPMVLLGIFAGLALLLAALGVYGVLAFAVGQRTSEIGLRLALGATRGNILGLILRQGAGLVALGLLLGLIFYFLVSALIGQLLFDVAPTDPATLLLAPLVLGLVALAACLLPARRATQVDPMVALRTE
jgi:putative ABC transport system permease protein